MISTERYAEYARGFLALGMLAQSASELDKIAREDRSLPLVLATRIELHTQEKQWPRVIVAAKKLAELNPEAEAGWIGWAYALRELNQIEEAFAILTQAEAQHRHSSALVHYNLACYLSLLGDQRRARLRLKKAFRLDKSFKDESLHDKDLAPLWDTIRTMP